MKRSNPEIFFEFLSLKNPRRFQIEEFFDEEGRDLFPKSPHLATPLMDVLVK